MVLRKISSFIAICSAAIAGCGSDFNNLNDSWELEKWDRSFQEYCMYIWPIWVLPVIESKRPEAIALLDVDSNIRISEEFAIKLTGMKTKANDNLARTLLKAEINRLTNKRQSALKGEESFSQSEEDELDSFHDIESGEFSEKLKPYLARAIANHEHSGSFGAQFCDDKNLIIFHGSLGLNIPQSKRIPIVVFLPSKPENVYLEWSVAK